MSIALCYSGDSGVVSFLNVTINGKGIPGVWSMPHINFTPTQLNDDSNRLESELAHVIVPAIRHLRNYICSVLRKDFRSEGEGATLCHWINKPIAQRSRSQGSPDEISVAIRVITHRDTDSTNLLMAITNHKYGKDDVLNVIVHGYSAQLGEYEVKEEVQTIVTSLNDAIDFFGKKFVMPFHKRCNKHSTKDLLNALIAELKTEGLESRIAELERKVEKLQPMLDMSNKMRGLFG